MFGDHRLIPVLHLPPTSKRNTPSTAQLVNRSRFGAETSERQPVCSSGRSMHDARNVVATIEHLVSCPMAYRSINPQKGGESPLSLSPCHPTLTTPNPLPPVSAACPPFLPRVISRTSNAPPQPFPPPPACASSATPQPPTIPRLLLALLSSSSSRSSHSPIPSPSLSHCHQQRTSASASDTRLAPALQ